MKNTSLIPKVILAIKLKLLAIGLRSPLRLKNVGLDLQAFLVGRTVLGILHTVIYPHTLDSSGKNRHIFAAGMTGACGCQWPLSLCKVMIGWQQLSLFACTVRGKKGIWSPSDFVRLLTDKRSVHNFDGRFVLTVRDTITAKESRGGHLEKL